MQNLADIPLNFKLLHSEQNDPLMFCVIEQDNEDLEVQK